MEDFVNKTDVSFSQLLKKDGWFSRLIFIQLIVSPIHTSIYWLWSTISRRSAPDLAYYFGLMIGLTFLLSHWAIGFLLWKKRTRFTITISIILLWFLLLFQRALFLLVAAVGLYVSLKMNASSSTINHRIYSLIHFGVVAVISLVLTVIWTRNLKRLKHFCP